MSSKGHVQVLPPWRSDGRCGPQFPVGKAPGECDPYGGAQHQHAQKDQKDQKAHAGDET